MSSTDEHDVTVDFEWGFGRRAAAIWTGYLFCGGGIDADRQCGGPNSHFVQSRIYLYISFSLGVLRSRLRIPRAHRSGIPMAVSETEPVGKEVRWETMLAALNGSTCSKRDERRDDMTRLDGKNLDYLDILFHT